MPTLATLLRCQLERAALDARNEAGPGKEPDGNRWNDCHYSNEIKRKAKKGQGL